MFRCHVPVRFVQCIEEGSMPHFIHSLVARLASMAIVLAAVMAGPAVAQDATDYLGVPGPIQYDGTDYVLAWSSKPSPRYTKQEYLPAGQAPESYEKMLLVEVLIGDIDVLGAATAQMDTLKQRKQTDPLVNMDLIRNEATGEAILDFIVSSKDDNGEYIVEWNAYRYASHADAEGTPGVLLFATSHRAYGGDNSRAFLTGLKDLRPAQIGLLANATLPGR
jgi:hypothetical protein